MRKQLLRKVAIYERFLITPLSGIYKLKKRLGLAFGQLAVKILGLSFLRSERVEAGVCGYAPEPAWKRKFELAAKLMEFGESLGKGDLDDLFDLFGTWEISSGGAGYGLLVPVKDLLERGLVAGQYKLYKLGIRPHGAHGPAGDVVVNSQAQHAFTLKGLPYNAPPRCG